MNTVTKMRLQRVDNVLDLADSMVSDLGEELGLSMRTVRREIDNVRRALDYATHPDLVPYPVREAAGNMFRSNEVHQPALCTYCGKRWPPAGSTVCADCAPPLPFDPSTLPGTAAERTAAGASLAELCGAIQVVPLEKD